MEYFYTNFEGEIPGVFWHDKNFLSLVLNVYLVHVGIMLVSQEILGNYLHFWVQALDDLYV